MGGGVIMAGEGHTLRHINVWVIGYHTKTQLLPAVVAVYFPILYLGLAVKFLTELDTG